MALGHCLLLHIRSYRLRSDAFQRVRIIDNETYPIIYLKIKNPYLLFSSFYRLDSYFYSIKRLLYSYLIYISNIKEELNVNSKSVRKIISCFVAIATALLFVGTSIALESNVSNEINTSPKNLSRGTYTFNPTDDSFIGAAGEINGNSPSLSLRNGSSGGNYCAFPVVKFNISSLPANASSLIVSANLYFYYYNHADNPSAGHPLVLHRFLGEWKEETIMKNEMPLYTSEQSAMTPAPAAPGVWISWNVTDDIQDFVSGALVNYGWILKDENYWSGPNIPLMYLYAKEQGNSIPYLEIIINEPPSVPQIIGQVNGSTEQSYDYNFIANDPEGQQLYYFIDWGDGQTVQWIGPYVSGQPVSFIHSWSEKGTYIIKAKAKDTFGAESDWGTLQVKMPLSYTYSGPHFLEKLFEWFPHLFPLVHYWLGY